MPPSGAPDRMAGLRADREDKATLRMGVALGIAGLAPEFGLLPKKREFAAKSGKSAS